ncbi:MAG: Clp protease N-terminal domain-containing protein, partial [Aggregatilineales bacterium]
IPPERIRRKIRHNQGDTPIRFNLKHVRSSTRLSELSRRVLNAAEQQATILEHAQPGIGHLLLALAQERRGVTADILRQSTLQQNALTTALERRDDTLLQALEPVLEEAVTRAETLGSHYVGADHLLLALASDEPGISLLRQFHVDTDKVIRLLHKHLDTR